MKKEMRVNTQTLAKVVNRRNDDDLHVFVCISMCIHIFARTIVTLCRGLEEPFPYFLQFFGCF